jgi:hypothetical protein
VLAKFNHHASRLQAARNQRASQNLARIVSRLKAMLERYADALA